MKQVKKIMVAVVAVVMVLAMTLTAFASENDPDDVGPSNNGNGKITITNPTKGATYKVYKVFNAVGNGTNISYTLVDGKTAAPAGFTVDNAGNVTYSGSDTSENLTAADITAIAGYVESDTPVAIKTVEGDEKSVEITGLSEGYYYITTTTGSAVTITSNNPNATVTDKNEAPEVDKEITGVVNGSFETDGSKALAEVGTTVTFTATIKVKNGAENYVFYDTMSDGLSYNNGSVKVKVDNTEITAGNATYTVAPGQTGGDDKNSESAPTFTITFNNDWIKDKVNNTITVTYTATVTSGALSTNPATNTAKVSYGDRFYTTESIVKVYNAKFTVTKKDGSNQPLAGAGFVIKNASGQYYKLVSNDIQWVDRIDDATEYISDGDGNVTSFTGLADGTYTLVEKTVPAGYNKAADSTFTIKANDYTPQNLERSSTVKNQSGSLLPSTGGIGTTVFYVIGGILVVIAGVLLVVKRRMKAEK